MTACSTGWHKSCFSRDNQWFIDSAWFLPFLLGHPIGQVEHSGMNVFPVRSNVCNEVDVTTAPSKSVHDLADHYPYSWNCVERIIKSAAINSTCNCHPADSLSSAGKVPFCSVLGLKLIVLSRVNNKNRNPTLWIRFRAEKHEPGCVQPWVLHVVHERQAGARQLHGYHIRKSRYVPFLKKTTLIRKEGFETTFLVVRVATSCLSGNAIY